MKNDTIIKCSFDDNKDIQIQSTLEVLRTSNMINNMLEDNPELLMQNNNVIHLTNTPYKHFLQIHSYMKNIAEKKDLNIHAQYQNTTIPNLTAILNTTSYLEIPSLQKKLIKNIAQKCDALNYNPQAQDKLIQNVCNDVQNNNLSEKIFSKMTTLSYNAIKTQQIIPDTKIKLQFINKATRNNKDSKIILCNGKEICTVDNHGALPYHTYLRAPKNLYILNCIEQYTLKTTGTRSVSTKGWKCQLINTETNIAHDIDKIIWSNITAHDQTITNDAYAIIPCFSAAAEYLLIRTYEDYDDNNKQFIGDKYKIIETRSNKILKIIQNNYDKIVKTFFCPSDKLFLQRKPDNSPLSTITLIDVKDPHSDITFTNIKEFLFNETNDSIMYCKQISTKRNEIGIYNLNTNKENKITLYSEDINLQYDKKNDTFIVYEKFNDKVEKINLYNQKKQFFQTFDLPQPLKNISIKVNKKTNDHLLISGTTIDNKSKKIFLHNQNTNIWKTIFVSYDEHSSLSCQFSASGQHIIYTYQSQRGANITCFNIIDGQCKVIMNQHATIQLHPKLPIAYLQSAQKYKDPLILYDFNKNKQLGTYITENMITVDDVLKKSLSENGKFLILYTKENIIILNVGTNEQILSLPLTNIYNVGWNKNSFVCIEKDSKNTIQYDFIISNKTPTEREIMRK